MSTGALYLIGFLSTAFYALISPLVRKSALDDFPAFAFIGITMTFMAAYGIAASLMTEKSFSLASVTPKTWLFLAGFALINFIAFALSIKALTGLPTVHFQLMVLAMPVIGGLFAWWLLNEPITPKIGVGFLIMCVGFYIAVAKKPLAFLGVN